MTQHDTEHLLEQLAQTLPEGSVPLDGVLAEARAAHKRHTRRVRLLVAGAAIAAVAVGVTVPVAFSGIGVGRGIEVATDGTGGPDPSAATDSALDALTPPQLAATRRVLLTYMDDNPDATVDTAWARHERGTVEQPNLGDCTSGELLRVNLFGSFPGIVASGAFDLDSATALDGVSDGPSSETTAIDPLAGTVTEVRLVADAETEVVCQLSVVTGTHDPDPRDEQIYPGPTAQNPEDGGTHEEKAPSLEGTYRVTALVGPDGDSLLTGPHADQLEMTFNDGVMTGTSGCNDIRAAYEAGGRELLFDAASMFSTTVGCEEPPLAERLLAVQHVSRGRNTIYLHAENWMIVVGLRR